MATIKQALKRVMDGRNRGKVIARGRTNEYIVFVPEGEEPKKSEMRDYIIIELDDGGHITEHEDFCVGIDDAIGEGDEVILCIQNNCRAEWIRVKDMAERQRGKLPKITLDIVPDKCLPRYDTATIDTDTDIMSCNRDGKIGNYIKPSNTGGAEIIVPIYPSESMQDITDMVKCAVDNGLDELVISTRGSEVGVWAFRSKKEEKERYHYTPDEYAALTKDKTGRKVLVRHGKDKDEFRVGTFISHSQKYNSSYYIAFDKDSELKFDHIHDENVTFMPDNDEIIEKWGLVIGTEKALENHFSFVNKSMDAKRQGDSYCYWTCGNLSDHLNNVVDKDRLPVIPVSYMKRGKKTTLAVRCDVVVVPPISNKAFGIDTSNAMVRMVVENCDEETGAEGNKFCGKCGGDYEE